MTQLGLSVEVRFLRVPVRWRVGVHEHLVSSTDTCHPPGAMVSVSQRCAVPKVSQDVDRQPDYIDGWELRNRFFRLKFDPPDEPSILEFLNDVGVWNAISDNRVNEASVGKRLLSGAFGSRLFFGQALSVDFADLQREQDYWRGLLTNQKTLKARFGPSPESDVTPAERIEFAVETHFFNELPLRMEWLRGKPRGIIETITGQEILIATIQLDLLRAGKFQVCQRPDCAIPFAAASGRQKKYCTWYCGHIQSVRRARNKEKQEHTATRGDK